MIVLACQKALLEGKIPDEELADERLVIVKALLSHGYEHQRIISFLIFLKNFIFIDNEEINRKFDHRIEELTNDKNTMGVIEIFKMQQREEGKLEGEAGKSHAVVENLITKLGLSDKQAADIAEVSMAFVKKVRKELEAKK